MFANSGPRVWGMSKTIGFVLLAIAVLVLPRSAEAGGWIAPGYSVGVLPLGVRPYGYPLDDSFDYPFGYGEYAQYGPWVGGRCWTASRWVPTGHGWRRMTFRSCR
jgi:hypothetical protein